MDEFLKVAITACIPAFTVIFGWGVNKAASIANSYVHNQFVQHCIQNAANRFLTPFLTSTRPMLTA